MPIDYEAPAPIGIAANTVDRTALLQQRLLQQQIANSHLQAIGSYGGGRGGGGGGSDIQAAINNRDQTQTQQEIAGNQAGSVPQSQIFAAQAQSAHQQQAAQLQAQLQQTELTQAENMRLTRMKNAIGDVQNDPTLSTEEKNGLTLQLKTGIDPYEKRQQMATLKAQEQLRQSQSDENDAQTAFKNRSLKISAMSAEDRRTFDADPSALAEITADIQKSHPNMPLKEAGKLAKETALAQNLGVHGVLQPDGKIEYNTHLNPDGSPLGGKGSSSGAAGGGTGGGPVHPTGLTPKDYVGQLRDAHKQAETEQHMQEEENGLKKTVHPQTIEWKNERVRQILEQAGLPPNMQAFMAQMPLPQKKGYDRSKTPWGKKDMATVATPAPPDTGTGPEKPLSVLDQEHDKVQSAEGLNPDEKTAATYLLAASRKLISDYPIPDKRPQHVKDQLANYNRNYEQLAKKIKPPGPSPVATVATPPTPQPVARGGAASQIPDDPKGGAAPLPPGLHWQRQPDGSLKASHDEPGFWDRLDALPKPSESAKKFGKWWNRNVENR